MTKARFFGPNFPFFGGPQNVLSSQTDERLIKNDLLQLLLTSPGERVFRPDFGTDIRATLFEDLTDQRRSSLAQNINQQIGRFESRVNVSSVVVEQDSVDENRINIKIYGSLTINRFERSIAEDIDLLVELGVDTGTNSVTVS